MAKRAPTEEKPYSPVRASLVDAVSTGVGERPALPAEVPATPVDERVVPIPRATRPARLDDMPAAAARERPLERLEREKRVLLTRTEEAAIGELVQRLSSSGATGLKLSHLLRACILILRHGEKELLDRVHQAGHLVRPPNDNALALAEFERRLAQEIAAAIRAAPPLR
jgi:hypothetical protein